MRRGRFFVGGAQATGAADDDDDDEDAACSAGAALAACFIRAERGGGSDGERRKVWDWETFYTSTQKQNKVILKPTGERATAGGAAAAVEANSSNLRGASSRGKKPKGVRKVRRGLRVGS